MNFTQAACVSCVPPNPHKAPPCASKLPRYGPAVFLGLGELCHVLLASLADFCSQALRFSALTEMKSCSWVTKRLLFYVLTVDIPFLTLWPLCVQSLTETVKLTTGFF